MRIFPLKKDLPEITICQLTLPVYLKKWWPICKSVIYMHLLTATPSTNQQNTRELDFNHSAGVSVKIGIKWRSRPG